MKTIKSKTDLSTINIFSLQTVYYSEHLFITKKFNKKTYCNKDESFSSIILGTLLRTLTYYRRK